jgi:hypothetical protein
VANDDSFSNDAESLLEITPLPLGEPGRPVLGVSSLMKHVEHATGRPSVTIKGVGP